MAGNNNQLSVLVVVHNEEERLAACLDKLGFSDEIVVVLDKCTDGSGAIARQYTDNIVIGSWEIEGDRRNAGIAACQGDWILEIDADEHVPVGVGEEVRQVISISEHSRHLVPFDNFIGQRCVRYGWGASFGTSCKPCLFRKGTKIWGPQRLHPSLTLMGTEGPRLQHAVQHYVDQDPEDMLQRLNNYSSARALDLLDSGKVGSMPNQLRRFVSRFYKCYVRRKGYREGDMGFLIALCAALYPLLSYLKARIIEEERIADTISPQLR